MPYLATIYDIPQKAASIEAARLIMNGDIESYYEKTNDRYVFH